MSDLSIKPPDEIPLDRDILVLGYFEWESQPYPKEGEKPTWAVCQVVEKDIYEYGDDFYTEDELDNFKSWLTFKDGKYYYAVTITKNPYKDYGIIVGWADLPK